LPDCNPPARTLCFSRIQERQRRKIRKEDRMIRGIKFIAIPVGNQDASLKFYTEALGFKVVTDQPYTETQRWIELSIPGCQTGLALFTPEGQEDRIGQFQSIAFWCDDVFATAKVLKSKGVQFASEPKAEDWGTSSVFKDPDGNQFALSSR
jgi:catechol 2,3-dioxygenase-like lactoylglutathione lyase family enzyme